MCGKLLFDRMPDGLGVLFPKGWVPPRPTVLVSQMRQGGGRANGFVPTSSTLQSRRVSLPCFRGVKGRAITMRCAPGGEHSISRGIAVCSLWDQGVSVGLPRSGRSHAWSRAAEVLSRSLATRAVGAG